MIEDDLIYMLKVGMYENSQKQGSYYIGAICQNKQRDFPL